MTEGKVYPCLKGEGCVVWKNTKKDGSPYFTVVVLDSIKINVYPYEPPKPKNTIGDILI